jgi:hypothetical protein
MLEKQLNYTRENDLDIKIGDTRPWVYDHAIN